MRIAVASGKGGTGKTTVATSLALSLKGSRVLLVDCDVETPNAHLFLNPLFEHRKEVGVLVPAVEEARCSGCGRCAEVCQFNAIAVMGGQVLVFPHLCHGCGSCTMICPDRAITEELAVLGVLEAGPTPDGPFLARGTLQVGELLAVPVIRQLKRWQWAENDAPWQFVVLDAPPGTSCPVVEAVRGSDFVLLVTEPTPFGLHDLRLMVEVVRELAIPAGVIINRDGMGDADVEAFCAAAGLPLLMRIPLQREIATGIAQGQPLTAICPRLEEDLRRVVTRVCAMVTESTP